MKLPQRMTAACVAAMAMLPLSALADQCKPDCGHVTEVSHYKEEGKASGLGAVAGGVAGGLLGHQVGDGSTNTIATLGGAAGGAYLGNTLEKKMKTKEMEKVAVTFDDGKKRSFDFEQGKSQLAKGDRVQLKNGHLVRYTGK